MKSHFKNHPNPQAGQAILTAIIFFLAISLTIVLGIATPVMQAVKIGNDLIHSKASYFSAEGALEDAVYRVKAGNTVNNGDTIVVNGYTTTIAVTSTLNGQNLEASSNYGGLYRNMQASLSTGAGLSFNYGMQTGAGGFFITGGSTVNGSVYSNGPIVANGGSRITGAAISADSASLASDQSNTSPTPITTCTSSTCITFGNAVATQDVAQSFQVSADGPLHDVQFYLKKQGSPSNITVRIVADNAGVPSGTDLLSSDGTIAASAISSSAFGWVDATLSSNDVLYAGDTYWLILDTGNNSSNYYFVGANSGGYAGGLAKNGQFKGTWTATSPAGLDAYFNLFMGGAYGVVCGGTLTTSCASSNGGALTVGTGSSGDTWAHIVGGVSGIAGTNYCQVGGTGSPYYDAKACTTTKGDPPAVSFPISASNISDWESQASNTSGGWTYTGDLNLGYQGTTTSTLTHITGSLSTGGGGNDVFTGGLEVDGNMTIGGGSRVTAGPLHVKGNLGVQSTGLTMTGTIWVEGVLTVESGGSIALSSLYGANGGVIVTNGPVTLDGGSSLLGSGNSSSYVLLATDSDCPISPSCGGDDAVLISGGSGAVLVYAPNGTINMDGGTNVDAMAANEIDLSGGATLNYNSGLVNVNFSSGPTGGWNVSSWQEVQ